MRIKFLVLLAVFCLSTIVVSAHDSMNNATETPKKKKVKEPKPEKPEQPEEWVEYDEIQTIKRKREENVAQNKTRKVEIKKEVIKKPKVLEKCEVRLVDVKKKCDESSTPEYQARFSFVESPECNWECNYDEIITATTGPPKKKTVIIKKDKKEVQDNKGIKEKEKKECSGEQVIRFSNCAVKIRGLIAFGAKTKNFDKKFEKLLNEKKKTDKGAKKPAALKKGASGKKAAAKPAAK